MVLILPPLLVPNCLVVETCLIIHMTFCVITGGMSDLFGGLGVSQAPPSSSIWEPTSNQTSKPVSSTPNGWSGEGPPRVSLIKIVHSDNKIVYHNLPL